MRFVRVNIAGGGRAAEYTPERVKVLRFECSVPVRFVRRVYHSKVVDRRDTRVKLRPVVSDGGGGTFTRL